MLLPPPPPPPPAPAPQEQPAEEAIPLPADVATAAPATQAAEAEPPSAAEQLVEAGAPDSAIQAPDAEEPPHDHRKNRRNSFSSLEIAEQVSQIQEWLTEGKRPNQIRSLCSQQWGLGTRVAEGRMQLARRQIAVDCNELDRRDMAATMIQRLEKVLEQAFEMKQGSNAIGAMRLQSELLQLISRNS